MIALSHKSKQYLLVTLKVFILGITFWYIYSKVTNADSQTLAALFRSLRPEKGGSILLFVVLAVTNWALEIVKWKTIITPVKRISFSEASKQSLAALTTSLATPNRIGDYGAKAYFFPSKKRKQVLLLNFIANATQMTTTLLFGSIGLIIVISSYSISFSTLHMLVFITILIALGITGFIFKEKELVVKGLSLKNIFTYIKKLPMPLKRSVWTYSLLRHACFSFLFLQVLGFFEAEIAISQAYPLIFAMYLLVSVVPTLFLLDVVVRGGVAVWLFSFAGVPELTVLCTVLTMWLLNFVIPALIGGFYLITYKPASS
jgi:hypothetical protein